MVAIGILKTENPFPLGSHFVQNAQGLAGPARQKIKYFEGFQRRARPSRERASERERERKREKLAACDCLSLVSNTARFTGLSEAMEQISPKLSHLRDAFSLSFPRGSIWRCP